MVKQGKIDFDKLWPAGAMEKLKQLRDKEMRSYQDPATGELRASLAEEVTCPLCDASNEEYLFKKEGFQFVRCRECDMVYVNPQLNKQAVLDLYNHGRYNICAYEDLYTRSAEYRCQRFYEERLDFIDSYFPARGKLLDIGTGRGDFIRSALERGWDAFGVEISTYVKKFHRDSTLIDRIYYTDVQGAAFTDSSFEVVTMWELLEHVSKPRDLLKEVKGILKAGGMLFIYVPNYASAEVAILKETTDHIIGDAHVNYFTPMTLQKMVEKVGFETDKIYTFGVDIQHIIWKYKTLNYSNHDIKFLNDNHEILQDIINKAGMGTNLRGFFRKSYLSRAIK